MRQGPGIAVDPERIKAARVEAGLSLRAIAGDDVSATFIHFVERGVSRPSRQVLSLIARRTGKPVGYFVAPPNSKVQPPSDLVAELAQIGDHLRQFETGRTMTAVDREVVKFIELTVRQSAELIKSIEVNNGHVGSNRRRRPER